MLFQEENTLDLLNTFVCRLAPRTHRRGRPRGTVIDSLVDTEHIDLSQGYEQFYSRTIARKVIPDPLVLEFGQPPLQAGHLLIHPRDLLVLLVGSDDPNGSSNERGVIGLATVIDVFLIGSGNTARCVIKAKPVVQLSTILDKVTIETSPFRKESMIDDIRVFGLQGAPQAHNCVRFFLEDDDNAKKLQRLRGLLHMFMQIDSETKHKLSESYPKLAELINEDVVSARQIKYEEEHPTQDQFSQPDDIKLLSFHLITALSTKPFVILTGPSGTGKSKIAIDVATSFDYGAQLPGRLIGSRVNPATCLAFVPVGSDWTDQRNLLGYLNPFGPKRMVNGVETFRTYEVTEALKLILRALHPDYVKFPHFLILDEMNLSHVERYFSSFLSLMEASRNTSPSDNFSLISKENLQLILEILEYQNASPLEIDSARALVASNRGLPFPPNLFIIGTVNVDETTYMFSPKVLDRAFVIEIKSVDPNLYLEEASSSEETIERKDAGKLLTNYIEQSFDENFGQKKPIELISDIADIISIDREELDDIINGVKYALGGIYKLLEPVGFGFGYRSVNEIFQYMSVWMNAQNLKTNGHVEIVANWTTALDEAILMKLLPKIHGNRRKLGDSLKALSEFFAGKSAPDASYSFGSAFSVKIEATEKLNFSLPLSQRKVEHLHWLLQVTGYTTFIS